MSQKLPDKRQQQPPAGIAARVDHLSWSGPLPPPEFIAKYNEAIPGLGDRVVTMAENEAAHRHDQERRALASDLVTNRGIMIERRIGQALAFLVAITVSCWGGFLVYAGHPVAGTIFGGAGLAPVVWAFVPKKDHDLSRSHQKK